jgi:competence protein ComEA
MRLLKFLAVLAAISAPAPPLSIAQQPPSRAQYDAQQSADQLLDINLATPKQLRALPGFGDAYVRRVIAGRPYTAKNQLLTRGVLPQPAYDQIASRIVAHRPPKR